MHPTGVVVSGYTDELGSPFYNLTLKEKYEASRASIEKIHPGHGKELKKPSVLRMEPRAVERGLVDP